MRRASISARNAITGSPLASCGPAMRPRPVGAIALGIPAFSSCSARNRVVWYSSRLGSGLACSLRRTSRSSSRRDSTDSSITLRQPTVVKAVSRFCESSTTVPILHAAAAFLEARGRKGSGPFRCRISTVMGRERLACCKEEACTQGRSLYPKGRRRRWLHRKPLRPSGYRLLNEAAGRHTVCFDTKIGRAGKRSGLGKRLLTRSKSKARPTQARRIVGIFPPRSGFVQEVVEGLHPEYQRSWSPGLL